MIADIVADLLKAAQCREIGDRVSKYGLPGQSHPCRQPGHVLFRYTGVHESRRKALRPTFYHAKTQITDHKNDAPVFFGQLFERLEEGRPHRAISNSDRALRYSSAS